MTRPIEDVVAEALQRMERTGRLDVNAYAAAYPEYAEELREILPVMQTLQGEQRWAQAERQVCSFAVGLFAQVSASNTPAADTVGGLFALERTESGLSVQEQARSSGLPVEALERLAADATPVGNLDNLTIKQLAARVSAPFATLLKEVRRLVSLRSLDGADPALTFTRNPDPTTEQEQKELLSKVKQAARKHKSPEGK